MARKSRNGVNVSEAIRDYLKANKDVGPTEAAKKISEQLGKTVSPAYVSNIKNTMSGSSKKSSRRGRKTARKTITAVHAVKATSNGHVDLVTIKAVKELLGHVSAETAKQLIDLLA